VASLHGPHPVSAQLQVKVPVKLARALHLQPGDEYFWRRSDDDPSILMLIPSEVVERRYGAGERLEAGAQPTADFLAAHSSAVDLPRVQVEPDDRPRG
jgi:hypothetical protein